MSLTLIVKDLLKNNGDENCLDETADYLEQVLLEFLIQFTLKIRRDESQKSIKPEDILVNLMRDERKFSRGSFILYQNEDISARRKRDKFAHEGFDNY